MTEYIVITTEGYTESPEGDAVENCQVLGRLNAEDKQDAIDKVFAEYHWSDFGYTKEEAIALSLNDY